MKPNRRKAVVSDPIKRIGLNGGNGAREIVIQIARALGFKIHEDEFGVSAYGSNSIRIADHCTYMQTWVDAETWNAPIRLDVVIEDEPTQAITQVKEGFDFTIDEYVYDSSTIDPQNARMIAYDIRNAMTTRTYANNVRGEKRKLVTTHGNNPQQMTCSTKMDAKLIRLTESDLHMIVNDAVNTILKEADRHREGYWKERWAKQKAAKQAETKEQNAPSVQQKKSTKPQKDRHRKGYYHDYNQAHPERLNRGFTKGYKNGNVSDGLDIRKDDRVWLDPSTYIVGYDELGRPITNHPLSDMLRNKEMEWHDDDWNEGSWDD